MMNEIDSTAAASAPDANVMASIPVWDLPVRLAHWLLAGGFTVAWLTGEAETWRLLHVGAGATALAAAAFRLLWGFIGTRPARFADFVRGPAAAWDYLQNLLRGTPPHYVGHNPAGGWAILALLGFALCAGVSGWLAYQDSGGDALKEAHEFFGNTMLLVVLAHLLGVAFGSWRHDENLARAMLTGRKRGEPRQAIQGMRPLAAGALLAWVVAATWWLMR